MDHVADSIAPLLPDGPWTVEPPKEPAAQWWREVRRPDGAQFCISVRSGRAEVSASLPGRDGRAYGTARDWYLTNDPPRISFDATRPADVLARDVARRFLPGFLVTWSEVTAKLAGVQAGMAQRDAAASVLESCGFVVDPPRGEQRRSVRGEGAYGFEVTMEGDVKGQFWGVNPDAAAAILSAVAPKAVTGDVATNERRAARGRAWAALFALAYDPQDVESSMRDALADLAHAFGPSEVEAATRMARVHWTAEATGREL